MQNARSLLVLGILLSLGLAGVARAGEPAAVKQIRKLWKRATAEEKAGDLMEHKVQINVGAQQRPGVGNWTETSRIFVRTVETDEGREEKIVLVRYKASLAAYFNELNVLYDGRGRPRFAFVPGEDPLRFYWDPKGTLVRFQRGKGAPADKPSAGAKKLSVEVRGRAEKLRAYGERLRHGSNAGPLFPEDWALLGSGE